ncbi:hypothetical protein CU254_02495 [Amycolatopsis sp. AA4]|uniref:hypothetical protein n=1 Tax=Actinomycetes TaxID=1760 RepID=UPI0001B539BE|nr:MULTISPECIES: hypothetical protein [Actinomycetes]ATY09470.1 hypothetical protein CU254_02495 [Amycolatopsis sp. AA4]EFL04813.1 predicted protein [Streptomyces sp. AA4]
MADIVWDQKPVAGSSPAAGTAGNDFLAGLTEGPGSHEAAQKMKTAGNTLKTLAQNGSFAVNEEGFRAYMAACDFFLSGHNRMLDEMYTLTKAAEMGNFDYGRSVAKFNVQVANGDHEAMIPNLILMREAVYAAQEALSIARKNYRETESAHSVSFAELNKKIDSQ